MCKTSVKKNLYFEIKDRVIEEAFNGVRLDRKKVKVKVYGLDSTKDIRARLIELLHDRVNFHKDKFISKQLHHELETLEVDNKGKTQAIYPNHDDQVFSYLMAIYVWYDGKDLAENYGIQKNTIKTDQDEEVIDGDIELNESVERLPLETMDDDINEVLEQQKEFMKESSKYISQNEFENIQYEEEQELFNQFLLLNKDAKRAYEDKYNVQSVENQIINGISYIRIPDSMFGNIDPDDTDELDREKKLHGNLYNMFTQV